MRLSNYHIPILKEEPSDATVISHKLMLKSGMIRQMSHGLYTIMPLGMRVLHKISNIIRKELEKINSMEVTFPIIQMNDAWVESGRANGYCGDETLRMKDRHGKEMLFSPTAEESATMIFKMDVQSYKSLPLNVYQIHWKFRDEIRPRFGLMRCREFLMMDAYSFDQNEDDAKKTYDNYFRAYLEIFKQMGLLAIPMRAATGEIGGDLSHEFHIIAETGESGIFYDKKLDAIRENLSNFDISEIQNIYAKTDEEHNPANCNVKSEDLIEKRGIEVGHIFYFADKYTKSMNASVQGKDGQVFNPVGGAYGIGVTRVMAAAIEASHDENGIIWPKNIAPFDVIILNLASKNEKVTEKSEQIYNKLISMGIDVLYDDTDRQAGAKFADADLIGIPKQIIIGSKLADDEVEVKDRKSGERNILNLDKILEYLVV